MKWLMWFVRFWLLMNVVVFFGRIFGLVRRIVSLMCCRCGFLVCILMLVVVMC